MEAAGVEPEIRGLGNLLMARDFWREFVDTAALAAARGFHSRPHESSVFDLVFGEITEAAGPVFRRFRILAARTVFRHSRRPSHGVCPAASIVRVAKARRRIGRRDIEASSPQAPRSGSQTSIDIRGMHR